MSDSLTSVSAKAMWAVIAACVVYHEINCDDGELLSEGVDRARVKHPVLVPVFIIVTAAHLLRRLPPKADPYAWLGNLRMKGTPTI